MKQSLGEGRYHLGDVIGYGGMATVYRAEDSRLGRTVAIKVLADNLAADPSFRERFLREARLAARLGHRNVVQVFDVGENGDRPFIVMECVEGGTLADALGKGPLARGRVLDLARQVAAGLAHAHAAGLVHRDIKPGNLLLARDGTVKIADFGIARAADSATLTRTGAVIGTEAYLAPEQAAGLPATSAADIYAFGVVLYEALTGERLGPHDSTGAIDRLTGIEPPLIEIIDRSLAERPADRPSAGDITLALGGEAATPTDPDTTAELPATAVLPLAGASASPPRATAVLPAVGLGTVAAARQRGRLLAGMAAIGAGVLVVAVIATRHQPKSVTSSRPTTTLVATTTTSTTLPIVVPPDSECGPVSLTIGTLQFRGQNPNCTDANADSDTTDAGDAADNAIGNARRGGRGKKGRGG